MQLDMNLWFYYLPVLIGACFVVTWGLQFYVIKKLADQVRAEKKRIHDIQVSVNTFSRRVDTLFATLMRKLGPEKESEHKEQSLSNKPLRSALYKPTQPPKLVELEMEPSVFVSMGPEKKDDYCGTTFSPFPSTATENYDFSKTALSSSPLPGTKKHFFTTTVFSSLCSPISKADPYVKKTSLTYSDLKLADEAKLACQQTEVKQVCSSGEDENQTDASSGFHSEPDTHVVVPMEYDASDVTWGLSSVGANVAASSSAALLEIEDEIDRSFNRLRSKVDPTKDKLRREMLNKISEVMKEKKEKRRQSQGSVMDGNNNVDAEKDDVKLHKP